MISVFYKTLEKVGILVAAVFILLLTICIFSSAEIGVSTEKNEVDKVNVLEKLSTLT